MDLSPNHSGIVFCNDWEDAPDRHPHHIITNLIKEAVLEHRRQKENEENEAFGDKGNQVGDSIRVGKVVPHKPETNETHKQVHAELELWQLAAEYDVW